LATAYAGLDRYAEALLHAERATQLEPKNRAGWSLLAALYRELDQPANANAASAQLHSLDASAAGR
jgi:Flp pilus assembly protein TadD